MGVAKMLQIKQLSGSSLAEEKKCMKCFTQIEEHFRARLVRHFVSENSHLLRTNSADHLADNLINNLANHMVEYLPCHSANFLADRLADHFVDYSVNHLADF